MILPGFPSIFAGRAPVTATWVWSRLRTDDATTYTWPSTSLGSAQTNRRLLAVMQWEPIHPSVSTVTALSIDGTAGTEVISHDDQYATEGRSSIWIVDGDQSATTGDVTVTVGTQAWKRMSLNIYAVYGNDFPQVLDTAVDFTANSATQTSQPIVTSLSGPCIAGVSCGSISTSVALLTGFTRDRIDTLENGSSTFAVFSLANAGIPGMPTRTIRSLNANGQKCMTAVSFF
jgi:hypothetical protein